MTKCDHKSCNRTTIQSMGFCRTHSDQWKAMGRTVDLVTNPKLKRLTIENLFFKLNEHQRQSFLASIVKKTRFKRNTKFNNYNVCMFIINYYISLTHDKWTIKKQLADLIEEC